MRKSAKIPELFKSSESYSVLFSCLLGSFPPGCESDLCSARDARFDQGRKRPQSSPDHGSRGPFSATSKLIFAIKHSYCRLFKIYKIFTLLHRHTFRCVDCSMLLPHLISTSAPSPQSLFAEVLVHHLLLRVSAYALRVFTLLRCVGCSRRFPKMFSNWIPTT